MESESELRKRLDKRNAQLLKAITQNDGAATATEIESSVGSEPGQVIRTRLRRLADLDLVSCSSRTVSEERVKTWTLTLYGAEMVRSSLIEDVLHDADRAEYESNVNQALRDDKYRLETLTMRISELEARVSNLEG